MATSTDLLTCLFQSPISRLIGCVVGLYRWDEAFDTITCNGEPIVMPEYSSTWFGPKRHTVPWYRRYAPREGSGAKFNRWVAARKEAGLPTEYWKDGFYL